MDEEEIWAEEFVEDQRWSWRRLIAVGVELTGNIFAETADALNAVALQILEGVNFDNGRRDMREQAALEMETLMGGTVDLPELEA